MGMIRTIGIDLGKTPSVRRRCFGVERIGDLGSGWVVQVDVIAQGQRVEATAHRCAFVTPLPRLARLSRHGV